MFWRGRTGRLRKKGKVLRRAKRQALGRSCLLTSRVDVARGQWASQRLRSDPR